jgi:zinc protease
MTRLVLPEVHRDQVDGVPVFWVDVDGPCDAALLFGSGISQEPLHLRGVHHLIEHLALHDLGAQPYDYNGRVDLCTTSFVVRGQPDEIRPYLDHVVGALHEPPLDRIGIEPDVLDAEAESRGPSTLTVLLHAMYGPHGPGVVHYPEFGVRVADSGTLRAWSERTYHRGGAALFLAGDPGQLDIASLDLSGLPVGPPASPRSLPERLDGPGWLSGGTQGFAAVAVLDRSTALAAATRVVREVVSEAVRGHAGASYAVEALYDPITADHAVSGLFVDAAPAKVLQARDALLATLDRLATDGPEERWLALDKERFERTLTDPAMIRGAAYAAARDHVLGDDDPTDRSWIDRYAELTPGDVAEVVRAFLEDASWVMPLGAPMPADRLVPPLEQWSATAVDGRPLTPAGTPLDHELRAGAEGMSMVLGPDRVITVRFRDVIAVEAWDDGSRVLHDRTGYRIGFARSSYSETDEFVAWLDASVSAAPRIPRGPAPD